MFASDHFAEWPDDVTWGNGRTGPARRLRILEVELLLFESDCPVSMTQFGFHGIGLYFVEIYNIDYLIKLIIVN